VLKGNDIHRSLVLKFSFTT